MKISVPEFLNEFVIEPMPIEVHIGVTSVMIYIGSETNWGAFKEYMKHFKDTEVWSVSADGGKLIVSAI